MRRVSRVRNSDLLGGSLARHLGAYSAAGHHHLYCERCDGADRAADREPEGGEQQRGDSRIAQRPDKQRENRSASGCRPDGAEHHRCIESDRAPAQTQELPSKTGALLGIGLFHRLGDLRHEIGDPRQPRREHVQQRCYAREQENRRQRHLDDMRDQVERRVGVEQALHFTPARAGRRGRARHKNGTSP